MKMTRAIAAGYLGGLIDGEGHIPNGTASQQRHVAITNTDPAILNAAEAACDLLGLSWRRWPQQRRPPRKPAWRVVIYGRSSLETVAREVPIYAPHKRARLEAILAAYTWRRPSGEFPELDEAIALYLSGRSSEQIARHLGGYSDKKVRYWLRRAGVSIRPAAHLRHRTSTLCGQTVPPSEKALPPAPP